MGNLSLMVSGSVQVDIPGPLGESAMVILESLPNICLLNGVRATKVLETRKHVIDSVLERRLPEWKPGDSLADRVISAMWLYLLTYRLADEEKIDETSVWYAFYIGVSWLLYMLVIYLHV